MGISKEISRLLAEREKKNKEREAQRIMRMTRENMIILQKGGLIEKLSKLFKR